MSYTDPTKNRRWSQMLTKGKKFLSLWRHPACYSYIQDVFDTTMRQQTQITNKIWALLQTTGGKSGNIFTYDK